MIILFAHKLLLVVVYNTQLLLTESDLVPCHILHFNLKCSVQFTRTFRETKINFLRSAENAEVPLSNKKCYMSLEFRKIHFNKTYFDTRTMEIIPATRLLPLTLPHGQ